jgi:hypothetical protein
MLLAAGSLPEFIYSFLGIIALVVLQLTVLTIIGTLILRYIESRNKRNRSQQES